MTTETETRCGECFAVHARIEAGWACTVHGHAFIPTGEEAGWQERWGCPKAGCKEGRWLS